MENHNIESSIHNPIEPVATVDDIMIKSLLDNSKAAIFGAIELHNKPIFSYRYETSIVLTINAWELAMKAFILKYMRDVKVIHDERSKEFLNCVGCISQKLGKEFITTKESIELIYKYRCDIIHFYGQKIESILYSLLRPNILYFGDFLLKYFEIDLATEANLIILPIGFKRIVSPIDFLSESSIEGSQPVKDFITSIVKSAKILVDNGVEDGLICNYDLHIDNVNKIKNADIVVGITTDISNANLAITKVGKKAAFTLDPNAPKFQLEEESVFKTIFTLTTKEFSSRLKQGAPDFSATRKNVQIIQEQIKNDPNYFRYRYLDVVPTQKSGKKGYYSEVGLAKAIEIFQ